MPNVLIYMSDEHNPFVSSLYGHPYVETPNMERLASRGTLFENAYCPSPLCHPCRSSFMSGLPVHQIQTYNNCNVFEHDLPSYGAVLRDQGVHTAYAGKNDSYAHSSKLGFRELIDPRDRKPPGDRNFLRRPLTIRNGARKRGEGYGPRPDPFRNDVKTVDAVIDWLLGPSKELDAPWTMTVNTNYPHFPHYVTQALWDKYAMAADLPEHGPGLPSAEHPYARDLRDHFELDYFTDEQIRGLRRGYMGCVEFVDTQLGRLLDALEESGQAEETLVVYTSDHGEMLGKFGLWWKSSLYEDSVRVPLIVSGPGFGAGERVTTPVSLLDLQATIFRFLERERPREWWGTPLQDIAPHDAGRAVFSEFHGHGVRAGGFVVRKGRWKLHYCMDAPHQLFDLASDPHELVNRAQDEPEVFADLERELRKFCTPEEEERRAHAFERKQYEALQRDPGA